MLIFLPFLILSRMLQQRPVADQPDLIFRTARPLTIKLTENSGLSALIKDPRFGLQRSQIPSIGRIRITGPALGRWVSNTEHLPIEYLLLYPERGGLFQIVVPVHAATGEFTYFISGVHGSQQEAVAEVQNALGIAVQAERPYRNPPEVITAHARHFKQYGQVEVGPSLDGPEKAVDPEVMVGALLGARYVDTRARLAFSGSVVISATDNPQSVVVWPSAGGQFQGASVVSDETVAFTRVLPSLEDALRSGAAKGLIAWMAVRDTTRRAAQSISY